MQCSLHNIVKALQNNREKLTNPSEQHKAGVEHSRLGWVEKGENSTFIKTSPHLHFS